jgi:HSP20 family protein
MSGKEEAMAIFRWTLDPWAELYNLREEVERAFGRVGRGLGVSRARPPVNVRQDDDGVTVTAEVPGVKAEGLTVETEGDTLRFTVKRDAPECVEDEAYHRRERECGELTRELRLPAGLDTEKVEASLSNGILTVKLPKAEAAKPRKVEVKAG